METLKFKTNIKCTNCVEKVTPALNEVAGAGNWKVDLLDPERTLTVEGDVSESELVTALKGTGYEASKI